MHGNPAAYPTLLYYEVAIGPALKAGGKYLNETDSRFKCYWLIFIVTSAGIVPRRHLTYLKSCPMDIPGDELLMSDVGTLTVSLSKL